MKLIKFKIWSISTYFIYICVYGNHKHKLTQIVDDLKYIIICGLIVEIWVRKWERWQKQGNFVICPYCSLIKRGFPSRGEFMKLNILIGKFLKFSGSKIWNFLVPRYIITYICMHIAQNIYTFIKLFYFSGFFLLIPLFGYFFVIWYKEYGYCWVLLGIQCAK